MGGNQNFDLRLYNYKHRKSLGINFIASHLLIFSKREFLFSICGMNINTHPENEDESLVINLNLRVYFLIL